MLDLVLAREKLKADEKAYDEERKDRRIRARMKLNGYTGPMTADDSKALRRFKFHMRESY